MILGGSGCSSIHVHLGLFGFKTLNLKADSLPVALPNSIITLFYCLLFKPFLSVELIPSLHMARQSCKGTQKYRTCFLLDLVVFTNRAVHDSCSGKTRFVFLFTFIWHGSFSASSLRVSTSSCSQKGQDPLQQSPTPKLGEHLEGKFQISAQPLSILMGSCALLRSIFLKCTPKCVSDQYLLLLFRK